MKSNTSNIYYDYHDILSFGSLLNFIITNRGGGKTYGFKDWAIRDFLKNKKQFIYLRRYKTEFESDQGNTIKNFFDDIIEKYPEHTFAIKKGKFYIDDEIAGYYIALSTSLALKSVSFPDVNKICYDEFLIPKHSHLRYLKNEPKMFLDLCETVFRSRDNWRAIFLGNSISTVSPYFTYFNIKVDTNKRFTRRGDITIELYTNDEFIEHKKETRFGRLINGTEYGDYSMLNKFDEDKSTFIEEKTKNSKYMLTFVYNNFKIGVWADYTNGRIYFTNKVNDTFPLKFSLLEFDHTPNTFLLHRANQNVYVKMIKEAYQKGYVRFQNQEIKHTGIDILNTLNVV